LPPSKHAATTERFFIKWNGKNVLGEKKRSHTTKRPRRAIPKMSMQRNKADAKPSAWYLTRGHERRRSEKPPQIRRMPITATCQ